MQYALGVDDLEDIANLTNATADTATVVSWTLLTTFNILFMQTGFALLEAGIARANSVKAVLLKNLMDFGTTIIAWWLFGYDALLLCTVKRGNPACFPPCAPTSPHLLVILLLLPRCGDHVLMR